MIVNDEEIFVVEYFKDRTKKLVYAPLRTCLFLVSNETAKVLLSKDNSPEEAKITAYLKTKKFIDIKKLHDVMTKAVPYLSISLTEDCNLKCIYCHANAGAPQNTSKTSIEKITQIIPYYFSYLDEHYPDCNQIQLSFMGGGEPTRCPRLMKYAVLLAKEESSKRGIKLVITTATNGCFSKRMADYIISEFSHISLSFDGPEFIQNTHRPFKNGKGSFDTVYNTTKYFQKHNFSFALRATLSTMSLEHYKDVVNFFATEFPGSFVGFEPLNSLGRGCECSIVPSSKEFAEGMMKICEYAEDKNIHIRNANLGKFYLLRTVFCNAVAAPSFTVVPNGEIWACTRENAPDIFRYGHFDFKKRTVEIDSKRLKKLKEVNVFNFPECRNCLCKYHCAGDCPDNRFSDLLKCKATKQLGVQILNKLINSQNITTN